jgi:hypothetical protein
MMCEYQVCSWGYLKINSTEVTEFITPHIFSKPRKERRQRK